MKADHWQRIEQIYHAALERPADQRETFIAEACSGDQATLREVAALLAANEQASGFLSELAINLEAKELAREKATAPLAIKVGSSLGHYKILSHIGAGGMGEVWLAQDTRLERRVAIKILPVQFTVDSNRLQRFIREARAASALNHPNIITIHEIGESVTPAGTTHFIATEYIEGETLRSRMSGEGLTLRQALDAAIQCASALDAAHQTGIIHRDIKPENIMIRPDGLVKVLDFGLAKLATRSSSRAVSVETNAQTIPAAAMTEPGMILGTLRYMSPEQARGHEVDARTDIFSLGAVLHEMITRQPLFAGETSADVIAAIIHKEPEKLTALAPDTPDQLERIVRKALAKDVRDRYQTARDLHLDLKNLKQELEFHSQLSRSGQSVSSRNSSVRPMTQQPSLRLRMLIAVAIIGAAVIGLAVWKYSITSSVNRPRPASRITKLFNERISSGGSISRVEFSPPDGKLIAYSINKENGSSIWVKQLASSKAQQITDGKWRDRNPIWSPDGQMLAFISDRGGTGGIWSVPYLGGETPNLIKAIDLANGTMVAWGGNGRTIYYEQSSNLFALDLTSGAISQLTNFDPQNFRAREFRISSDGKMLLYSTSIDGKSHIQTQAVQQGRPRQITFSEGDDRSPDWLPDGNRFAFSSNRNGRFQVYVGWIDGPEPEQLAFTDDDHESLTVSPDGSRIITLGQRENANLFSCDIRTGIETGQTSEFGIQLFPEVSPDGQRIAFQASDASINLDEAVMIKNNDAESRSVQIASTGFNATWSPRGDLLAFIRYSAGKSELFKVSDAGQNQSVLASDVLFSGQTGVPYNRFFSNYGWSPDGGKIVYRSAKSGQENLWVVPINGQPEEMITSNTDPKTQVYSPFWSPDERQIGYLSRISLPDAGTKKSINITEQGKSETVYETTSPIKLIGWSASGDGLIFALGDRAESTRPQKITLLRVSIDSRKTSTIGQIDSAYLYSVSLLAGAQSIALVSRQNSVDNIEIISASNGSVKQATSNSDTTAYYSGINWSPDGKTIYYSKQTNWVFVSLVENFQ